METHNWFSNSEDFHNCMHRSRAVSAHPVDIKEAEGLSGRKAHLQKQQALITREASSFHLYCNPCLK